MKVLQENKISKADHWQWQKKLPITLEDVKKAVENDDFIQKIKIKSGWTRKQKKGISVSPLSICEQVLLYADRVVMPYVLQKKILAIQGYWEWNL